MADNDTPSGDEQENAAPTDGATEDAAAGADASADSADSSATQAETDAATASDGESEAVADADLSPEELLAALATGREAVAQAQDQALRAKAEMETLRRRTTRDVENAHKFALEKFSKALIPVFESLEKAEASKGDATDAESAAAVLEGVSLSLKLFKDTLEKQGVTQLDPHGEPFDPNLHEAVAMVPMPDSEPNSIIEVIRKGFDLNGRLIQAAQVVVSKGND